MKRILSIVLAVMALATVVKSQSYIPFTFNNISLSNSAALDSNASNTWPNRVSGEVVGIQLVFSGLSPRTVDVDVVTTAAGPLGLSRTLLSLDSITANGYYPVRISGVTTTGSTTTNWPTPFVLVQDFLEMNAYKANATNANLKAYLILK